MTVKCKFCFNEFEAKRSTATFCSDVHRTLFGKLSDEEKKLKEEDLLKSAAPVQTHVPILGTKEVIKSEPPTLEVKEKNGHEHKYEMGIELPKPRFDINEKKKKIAEMMGKINKDYGAGSVMFMDEKNAINTEYISTGNMALDSAIGLGGFPRGRIIEIYGQEATGKTTICLQNIAEAQKLGGMCAFIDAEHAFDKKYAQSLGVNVDDLLVSQPDYGEQALEITDRLILTGAFDVVVVDSVAALVPKSELEGEMGDSKMGLHARLMSQACRKLTATVSRTKTILIFVNQVREKISSYPTPPVPTGGNALKFYSSVRLDVRKAKIQANDKVIGYKITIKVAKNKVGPPFNEIEYDMIFGEGVNKNGVLVDLAVDNGIIEKSGSWYSYNETKLGQGRTAVCAILNDHPAMFTEIETKVKNLLFKQ